jgi:hypothetical protein
MPLGNRMVVGMLSASACANVPTITAVSKSTDNLLLCFSGATQGWVTTWALTIAGTLQAGQEYYWEKATDSLGTSWVYWRRGTSASEVNQDVTVGSDGTGASTTVYCKVRAYVVPVGASPPSQCNGPTTSTQSSRTALSCAA